MSGTSSSDGPKQHDQTAAHQTHPNGSSASASTVDMRKYVTSRLVAYKETVKAYVDERLRGVSDKLNGKVMDSADTIAAKLNKVARDTGGECSYESAQNSNDVFISRHRLHMMNTLREKDMALYDKLTHACELLRKRFQNHSGAVKNEDKEIVRFFAAFTSTAGSSSAATSAQQAVGHAASKNMTA